MVFSDTFKKGIKKHRVVVIRTRAESVEKTNHSQKLLENAESLTKINCKLALDKRLQMRYTDSVIRKGLYMYQTTIKTELLFGAVKSTKYPVEKTRDESVAAAIAAYEAEGYSAEQLLAIETSKIEST